MARVAADRTCEICGTSIDHRHYNARYCRGCAGEVRKRRVALATRRHYERLSEEQREERLRRQRERRPLTAAEVNARRRLRYAADPEKSQQAVARVAEWRRKNFEQDRLVQRRHRKARPDAEYAAILRGDVCSYCGGPARQVDHITAAARGGEGGWENLTAACLRCNSRKQAKDPLDFLLMLRDEEAVAA